jgi:hypothetical protein
MFKGNMGDNFTWAESSGATDVKSVYKNLTFVNIEGKIHIRSGHLPEEPFVALDSETCKVQENYEPWTSEDNLLNWTSDSE